MKKQIRREKIINLLVKGLTLEQIGKFCGVSEKTVRRDLLEISKDYPDRKQESVVLLIEGRKKLFRDSIDLFDTAENNKEKSRALLLREKVLSSLEKTYSRFGLIPTGEEELSEDNEVMWTKGQWREMMIEAANAAEKETAEDRQYD